MRNALILGVLMLLLAPAGFAQTEDKQNHDQMMQRGDHVMGFSHEKTTHHFQLFKDGGAIVVTANDAKDQSSIDQIRMHLGHIAKMFAAGNFNAPMLVHAATPPGTATMGQLREQIHYEFSEVDSGAQIRISTQSQQAMDAIHAFLLFQIVDHQTGDSPVIH